MKILLISPSIYMSSVFSDMIYAPRELAVTLADGLVDRGHDVTFATAPDVETRAKLLPGDARFLGLVSAHPDHALIKRDYEVDLLSCAFSTAGSFDVVHVWAVTMAHYFEQFTNLPVVYTLHDPLPTPGDLGYAVFEKFASHAYVSISDSQRKSDLKLDFAGTVYHGIDTALYPFHAKADNGFVFLGRLVPEKGVTDAIKACVVTNERLLIGSQFPKPGESDYVDRDIRPMLDDPKIEEVGMVTDGAKAELLGRAKALLFPIHWEEPFGMVMIEAMAAGTPVIGYRRGSVPEIVKDGVTGFIVEPNDGVEGLVRAMKRIGEIDRAACRKHVEERFSVEQMVKGYERVYHSLLDKSR